MNFKEFKKKVEEQIHLYPDFRITKKGSNFIWIGKNRSRVGNWSCHYEIIKSDNKIYPDIHCEHFGKNEFWNILSNKYEEAPHHNKGVRLDLSGFEIEEDSIKKCFQLFSKADDEVGEDLEKIGTQVYNDRIDILIKEYKNKLQSNPKEAILNELYKWKLIEKTRNAEITVLINEVKKTNLVYTTNYVIMYNNLLQNDKETAEATKEIISNLFDEKLDFFTRLDSYQKDLKKLCEEKNYKVCVNDERTALTFLSCKYPEKYTFFKTGVYKSLLAFFDITGEEGFNRVTHYLSIVDDIASKVKQDTEIINELQKYLNGNPFYEKLVVQTILWVCLPLLSERTNEEELLGGDENMSQAEELSKLLKKTYNLILHGAPGTGKTYLAKKIAKELGCTDNEIGFVQFHPSYDYTDFVEGIRPSNSNEGIANSFERMDGVFKEFCKKALLSRTIDSTTISELRKDATVWKISLKGTGDNPVRRDCLENGYIRLGFNEEPEYITEETPAERGKNELNAFEYKMQKGDIVLSCYSNKEIDAIGIVTGDYYVDKENNSDYWRFRNVKWLVKNIKENIYELNNRTVMTLSSVYKLSIPLQSVLDIVKKYTNPTAVSTDKPYVFIIDEINRGELSKIFGELFFSIEPGYRGEEGLVQTQYQNLISDGDAFKKGFYIPKNIYVIGTMNDIDRSVESMDLAMRRRFTFKEITAEDSCKEMLSRNNESISDFDDSLIDELKDRMNSLNQIIISDEIGLSSAYQIGAAYFLKYKMYMDEENPFECLWNYNLEPLLIEYLRGQGDVAEKIERLKEAYNLVSKN